MNNYFSEGLSLSAFTKSTALSRFKARTGAFHTDTVIASKAKQSLFAQLFSAQDCRVANAPRNDERKSVQYGRSMIEMLGVLAIIGVLSVGGIAGYSKAMMKFKINKTIDQVSQIVANTRTLYGSQRSYNGLGAKIAKKAHLVPDEMFDSGSGGSLSMTNAFGGEVWIASAEKNSYADNKAFTLEFRGIPEEACIELLTQDWGASTSSGLVLVAIGNGGGSSMPYAIHPNCTGDVHETIACPRGSKVSVPMPISVATDGCNGDSNDIVWKYY